MAFLFEPLRLKDVVLRNRIGVPPMCQYMAQEGLANDWHHSHYVALARGGFYHEGAPAAGLEHVESYLRGVLNFIGVEPEFVAADGLAISPEHRANSIREALGETLRLAA